MSDVRIGGNINGPTIQLGPLTIGTNVWRGNYDGAKTQYGVNVGFGGNNYSTPEQTENKSPFGRLNDALALTIMAATDKQMNQAFNNGPGLKPDLIKAVEKMGGWDQTITVGGNLSAIPSLSDTPRGWTPLQATIPLPAGTMTVREYVQGFYANAESAMPGANFDYIRQEITARTGQDVSRPAPQQPAPPPQGEHLPPRSLRG
jgi:hypothetical protein